MKTFRNIGGPHYTVDGQRINKGELIETDEPLDEMFANHFEEVKVGTKVTKVAKAPTKAVVKPKGKARKVEATPEEVAEEGVEDGTTVHDVTEQVNPQNVDDHEAVEVEDVEEDAEVEETEDEEVVEVEEVKPKPAKRSRGRK